VVEDCPERSFHPDSVDLCVHLVGTSYRHRRPKLIGMNALHKKANLFLWGPSLRRSPLTKSTSILWQVDGHP